MRTWIKFCGTTCLEDAMASIDAGVDALGFIFAPSQRCITPERAREIIRELPGHIERIGVFLNQGAEQISNLVNEVELSGLQLHGEESPPEIYVHLDPERRGCLRKIKTVLVEDGFQRKIDDYSAMPEAVDTWLLDSGAGSGRTFDWHLARAQLGDRKGPFIVAGGLTPGNVAEALREFHPWGVDVVSGVESRPGRKNPEKMKAFVAAVRKAESD
ncbi:MAG: phosphoribosylanthranilate isomerase [Candidatus Angelobacter sp.]